MSAEDASPTDFLGRRRVSRPSLVHRQPASALSWATALAPAITVALTWLAVLAAIALTTWAMAATGGAPNPLAHLYYLPILYAAVRHGVPGAVTAAVIAGLAAGPWMPTESGGAQATADWAMRLFFLVVVGAAAAWLARQHPRPLDVMVRDIVVGRSLRAALKQFDVNVHYQPIIDLATGTVVGVEALARWNDRAGNAVPPITFIPVAERTGSIGELGAQVMEKAIIQATEWATHLPQGLVVAVNVSAVQLGDPNFETQLRNIVGAHHRAGFRLCIEITETALLAYPERARKALATARSLGLTVALDDFGTGQSSLAHLLTFDIDAIKIDKSFVAAIDTDPKALALVTAVQHMAVALGATTVAEGIETPRQLAILKGLGCHQGQGYYVGMPSRPESVDWSRRTLAMKAASRAR